jgi:hypothetical protein
VAASGDVGGDAAVSGRRSVGTWLGVHAGEPWRDADGAASGVFVAPLVQVVPVGTWWTACFHPVEPKVDVDIVLPAEWDGDVLEQVDLELAVLGLADGTVR